VEGSDVFAELSRVPPAQQERSRRAQREALEAFEALLKERPYSRVAMQDVADRAGLAITSVYARFDGKSALVLAAHERIIASAIAGFDAMVEAESANPSDTRDFVTALIAGSADHAEAATHILQAVLAANDKETSERAAFFIRASSERLAAIIAPRLPRPRAQAERDIDFAWRSVVAVLQQTWALSDTDLGRFPLGKDELVRRLADQFLAAIHADTA
jgi:AcrR family transcriptional regulator